MAPKSRLGFLAASANSVKGTFSAIHDRLSNDREAVGKQSGGLAASKSLQQPRPPRMIARSQSGVLGPSAPPSNGSLGGYRRSEMDLLRLSTETNNQPPSGGFSTISSTSHRAHQQPAIRATGLSLAYDVHVRKSKSSQALSTLGSSAGNNRSAQSVTPAATAVVSKVSTPAPPPPPLIEALDQRSPLPSSFMHGTSKKAQVVERSLSKPLPAPPRTISKSYSSSLLRPTASSLARMQATLPPPSRNTATPAAAKSFLVPSYQDSPTFSRVNIMATAASLPTPRGAPSQAASLIKKSAHLVPKSPHRRAMEKHTAAGRASGGTGGATGGLKTTTFQARLAMGHKQREIEERRRARLEGGKMVF